MDIPTRYNPKEVETKIYKMWLESGCFNANVNHKKKPFCIVIPPPNITGILHMGHALNNTIQDVLIRLARMQGFEALWMPGTDHAGIATQNVVEKDLAKAGKKKEDLGREVFSEKLWAWTDKYGKSILGQLKKIGSSCDWKRTRFTMDTPYSESVKEVFVRLYEKGLIYRGEYIINWCPRCKTALSDEEAARKEIDGWLYYIKYPVMAHSDYVVVATTRPETMLGDTAIAINPNDERYKWLKGTTVILPILERQLSVIEDTSVDPEFGTGVVKVTPSHDPADFIFAKKHNLPFINIMNDDASLNENAGDFCGMDRLEARAAILEVLEEKKLIEKKEPYKISAGHCYRCHTIIEPRLSPQWFVKMKPLAEPAIKVVEEGKIKFYPERWKKVYLNWMYNIQDWCISRQIWWGHRLPVYYCRDCQKLANESTVNSKQLTKKPFTVNSKLTTVNKKGTIVSRIKPEKCPDCGSTNLIQDEDVLDTWFSSWLWPFATLYWPAETQSAKHKVQSEEELKYFYPTSVLVTASEILFFWVARMIMAGLEFMKQIPFGNVLIHGTVRDERGIKMSKSLGNIIDPLEIIDKYGADPLRFSLMLLASSGSDIHLSDEKFLVGRNFCNKIWNAARFILMKVKETNITSATLRFDELDEIDMWVIKELDKTIDESSRYFEHYRINEAVKTIYEFFWHVFCDWYIEIAKDNFTKSKANLSLHVLIASIKLLHPVIPFITEEIFQLIKTNTALDLGPSITVAAWPSSNTIEINEEKISMAQSLIQTIREIRNTKIALGVGSERVLLQVKTSKKHRAYWDNNSAWIRRLAQLKDLQFTEELQRVLYKSDNWELNFLLENINANNFIHILDKKINEKKAIFNKVSQRLANENFLKNAQVETIGEEKIKFNELELEIARLKELKNAFK